MFKPFTFVAKTLVGVIVLLIGAPLLWILGRPSEEQTGELVVTDDVDSDDPGEDIDQEE